MAIASYLLLTFVPALIVSWGSGFVLRRYARSWGLVDRPTRRKDHAEPIPLGGDIAIWLGTLFPLLASSTLVASYPAVVSSWLPPPFDLHVAGWRASLSQVGLLFTLATALLLLGLADDRRGLSWQLRMIVQVVVALIAVYWGNWHVTLFLDWDSVTRVVSVLWIVAMVNAFNMLDNMDCLSGGVATIICAVLATIVLAVPTRDHTEPQWFVAGLLWLLCGGVAGYLWHNRTPARLFMGDAGSYFLGFCLAIATMQATFADYQHGAWQRLLTILTPPIVMAVPLYDLVSVVVIRLRQGRSPLAADHNHLSHRLVRRGISRSGAVRVIHALTAISGLVAVLAYTRWRLLAIVPLALLVAAMAYETRFTMMQSPHNDDEGDADR